MDLRFLILNGQAKLKEVFLVAFHGGLQLASFINLNSRMAFGVKAN